MIYISFNKKHLLLLLTFLIYFTSYSQNYKLKKNTIYLDKEPVAQVNGEAGVDSTYFKVLSLNNEEIAEVTQKNFITGNPFLENLYWYELKFKTVDQTLRLNYIYNCNLKCVFNRIIFPTGIQFDKPIDQQIAIIAKHDVTSRLKLDSLDQLAKNDEMLEQLKSSSIKRDKYRPVDMLFYKTEPVGSNTKTTYHITQDSQIIGKTVTYNYGGGSVIEVYKKVIMENGNESFIPLAKSNYYNINLYLTTVSDAKKHEFDLLGDKPAHLLVAKYLVKHNYL